MDFWFEFIQFNIKNTYYESQLSINRTTAKFVVIITSKSLIKCTFLIFLNSFQIRILHISEKFWTGFLNISENLRINILNLSEYCLICYYEYISEYLCLNFIIFSSFWFWSLLAFWILVIFFEFSSYNYFHALEAFLNFPKFLLNILNIARSHGFF